MVKKRKSGGRTGSSKGRDSSVTCSNCGALVPRGKAKRFTKRINFAEYRVEKELRDAGALIPRAQTEDWWCIPCAIHFHKINIRAKDERKRSY